jgi:hypothetical protein
MDKNSSLGIIGKDSQEYLNLAVDEAKLKITRGLSTALSQVLAYLVIIFTLSLVVGLLSLALLQWINGLLGAPWGTLIVAAFFVLALVVLWANRQKMFRDLFVQLFIDVFYDNDDE